MACHNNDYVETPHANYSMWMMETRNQSPDPTSGIPSMTSTSGQNSSSGYNLNKYFGNTMEQGGKDYDNYNVHKLTQLVRECMHAKELNENEKKRLKAQAEGFDKLLHKAQVNGDTLERNLKAVQCFMRQKEEEYEKLREKCLLYEDLYRKQHSQSKRLTAELCEGRQRLRTLENESKVMNEELGNMQNYVTNLSRDMESRLKGGRMN